MVNPCIAQMQLSHARRLLILAWKMRRVIRMEVNVEQLHSTPWSLDNRGCAMRKCKQKTGIFVPWHAGGNIYHTGSRSYSGPLATRGETSTSSIDGPARIEDWINEKGPHLVVCSFGCLQDIRCLQVRWPRRTGECMWQILRGTEAFVVVHSSQRTSHLKRLSALDSSLLRATAS